MVDQKITELAELTTPANVDLFAIVDDPSGTPATKKITLANIKASLEAVDASIEVIGSPTYDDVQDVINNTQSAGDFSGGIITDATAGKVDISAVTGFLKTTDSDIGVTPSFDLGAASDFVLTDNSANYIYVDYNGGTPQFAVTTDRSTIELNRHFILGRVYREGTDVHIVNAGVNLHNFLRDNHERLIAVRGFERASGGVISETGNRYLISTSGVFYLGNSKVTTSGVNTSGAPTFTRHYHVAGVWSSDTKSQICQSAYQYDDGTDLATIDNNKYGVFWVYIHFESDLHVVVGRGNYTLAGAEEASLPDTPDIVHDFGTLAAKIIVKKSATNFTEVDSAYEQVFPTSTPVNHNDLGGIQGGAADDYFHLTSAQHTIVVYTTSTQTLTNKRIDPRVNTIASSATPTPAGDTTDIFTVTALGAAATFAAPTGTPVNGQKLIIRIKDDGTARALTYNAIYREGDVALPTTTILGKTLYLGFMYNSADTKWDLLAYNDNL